MGQVQSSRRGSHSSNAPLHPRAGSLDTAYEVFYGETNFQTNLPHRITIPVIEIHQESVITRPEKPRVLRRMSELIDPLELMSSSEGTYLHSSRHTNHSYSSTQRSTRTISPPNLEKQLPRIVQSPSGTTLGALEYTNRQDRPLAIRERQESIRRALERHEREERARQAIQAEVCTRSGRKGSGSSTGTWAKSISSGAGSFEKARIEEGARIQGIKDRKRAGGSNGRFGCLNCFGSKAE